MHDQDNQRPTGCSDCGAFPTTAGHRCPPTTPVELEQLVDEIEKRIRGEVRTDIWNEVRAERERAHVKHGDKSMESSHWTAERRLRILLEEVGEVAKEFNDADIEGRTPDAASVRKELIQVAAMAGAWADACQAPEAKRLRASVTDQDAARVLTRVAYLDAECCSHPQPCECPCDACEHERKRHAGTRASEAQVEAAMSTWDRVMPLTGGVTLWRAIADAVVAAGDADEVARLRERLSDVADEYRKTGESWDRTRSRLEGEVERLRGWIDRSERMQRRAEAAEAEVARWQARHDEVAGRLSALLCELTNGRLSKPTYDVRTMVAEIDSVYDDAQQEDRAERDRLAATLAQVDAYRKDKAQLLGVAIDAEVREWLTALVTDLTAILEATPEVGDHE